MLAQILGTFRARAVVALFGVLVVRRRISSTLPGTSSAARSMSSGIRIEASRLLAGVVALAGDARPASAADAHSLGSKMLAVAEDSTAAQLMGIRPDTMQAIAWAIAAGATHGLAGALIATFLLRRADGRRDSASSPSSRSSLGGSRQRAGARWWRGSWIGVIESLSAYLDRRSLQGHRWSIRCSSCFLWFRPQGPDGQDCDAPRLIWLSVALALVIAYPLLFSTPFQQIAARCAGPACSADRGVGLEHHRRLRRTGIGRPCRAFLAAAPMLQWGVCAHFGLSPLGRHPRRRIAAAALLIAAVHRRADAATVRALFQHGARLRVAELARLIVTNTDVSRRGRRAQRSDRAAQRLRSLLHLGAALLLSASRVLVITLGITW